MTRWEKIKLTWRLRRTHLLANSWGLCLGLLAFVSCIIFFTDPKTFIHASAVGIALHDTWLVYAWTILYGIGGLGMLVGLLTLRTEIDVAGLCCFAGATVVQMIGIVVIWPPLHWLALFTYGCFALAALMRINAILRSGFR